MLLPEEKKNYDKQELLSAFQSAQELNMFLDIESSIEQQKEIRDEWE